MNEKCKHWGKIPCDHDEDLLNFNALCLESFRKKEDQPYNSLLKLLLRAITFSSKTWENVQMFLRGKLMKGSPDSKLELKL